MEKARLSRSSFFSLEFMQRSGKTITTTTTIATTTGSVLSAGKGGGILMAYERPAVAGLARGRHRLAGEEKES
jgi:hypothetical protein